MIALTDNAMMASGVWPQMKSCIAYCQLYGIYVATACNQSGSKCSGVFTRLLTSYSTHIRPFTYTRAALLLLIFSSAIIRHLNP